jgi:hypothetical protein
MMVALGLLWLLPALPASAGWLDLPSVCLVNTMTRAEMPASEFGPSAMERFMVSGYRGSSGSCPLDVEDTLERQAKDQAADWLLGLRSELRFSEKRDGATHPLRRSFFLRASRKRVLAGFGLEW